MLHEFSRTELLIGKDALNKLKNSKVAIFGVGGVGSFTAEGLARAGVGKFILVDDDLICLTNINRQIHATRKTVGKPKVEVMRDRILEINPKAEVTAIRKFYMPDCAMEIIQGDEDYIVDAIDTVTAKIDLVVNAKKLNIPIISAMGAGNKLDPTRFEVTDIYKTSICPLAKVMRRELRKRGIDSLKVVYSREEPIVPSKPKKTAVKPVCLSQGNGSQMYDTKTGPGSISFVPSVVGLIIAGEVVKDLIKRPDSAS